MGEKEKSGLFNVIVCTYNGVKVYTPIGTFLLYKLSQKCNEKRIYLYRDDAIAISENISCQQSGKVKKDFQKLFKENEL